MRLGDVIQRVGRVIAALENTSSDRRKDIDRALLILGRVGVVGRAVNLVR